MTTFPVSHSPCPSLALWDYSPWLKNSTAASASASPFWEAKIQLFVAGIVLGGRPSGWGLGAGLLTDRNGEVGRAIPGVMITMALTLVSEMLDKQDVVPRPMPWLSYY